MLSGYDWDFTAFEDEAPMTDTEYVERLLGEGHTVLSGQRGNHPELPNLHDIPGLRHVGLPPTRANYARLVEQQPPAICS